jgi:hypothetical protein
VTTTIQGVHNNVVHGALPLTETCGAPIRFDKSSEPFADLNANPRSFRQLQIFNYLAVAGNLIRYKYSLL